MAQNCSRDVSLVVDYVDRVGQSGSKRDKKKLQKLFGLEDLEHYDDFAGYVYLLLNWPFCRTRYLLWTFSLVHL